MTAMEMLVFLLPAILALELQGSEEHDDTGDSISLTETYIYQDSEFIFFSEKVTWHEGKLICPTYKARLAIIDDLNKARFIAQSMAYSNLELEYLWIGAHYGHHQWIWSPTGDLLEGTCGEDGYPPWSRNYKRLGKDCLALSRKGHDFPLFTDLDCHLQHSFICEKSVGVDMGKSLPVQHGVLQKMSYTLFHGHFDWQQAVVLCRAKGMRIATVPNVEIANELGLLMLKSRPDLENLWIGGYYHKSQWRWVTTGQVLPSVMGEDGYPPWLYNSSRNNSGCVLLDRHLCDHPVLVEMSCDRKRGFLCEQSQKIEDESSKEVEIRLADRNVTLYNIKKSWGAAFTFCLDHNSRLIVLNNYEDARFIMYGMADHVDEIKHVWIGGHLQNNTWLWAATGEKIPSKANSDGFPFWSKEVMSSERGCLNLDRLPYSTPLLYGLNCNTIQPFICEAGGSVNTSPSKELLHSPFRRSGVNSSSTTQAQNAKKCYLQVLNGTWHNCSAVPYSQDVQCTLVCKYPLSVFGSKEVRCSLSTEDVVGYRRLRTPPQCLAEDKLISHFEGTLQKIYSSKKRPDCILFLVNGNADKFQITSEFLQAFILTVPLNQDFPAGMISYAGNEVMIPMKETDACQMQLLVQELEAEERETKDVDIAMGLKLVHSTLHKDKKQCCIIVLLWNGTDYISDYQKYRGTVERLRDEGHYIFAIGEEEGMNKQLEPFVSSNNIDLHMYIFRRQQQYQHWLDFAGYIHDPEEKNCLSEDIRKRTKNLS